MQAEPGGPTAVGAIAALLSSEVSSKADKGKKAGGGLYMYSRTVNASLAGCPTWIAFSILSLVAAVSQRRFPVT